MQRPEPAPLPSRRPAPFARTHFARAILPICFAAVVLAGCAVTAAEKAARDPRPGLADVKPLGPAGRKCFEFCAGQEVSCRQMCPSGAYGECRQDCEADTRECLEGCPDLLRPEPPHKK